MASKSMTVVTGHSERHGGADRIAQWGGNVQPTALFMVLGEWSSEGEGGFEGRKWETFLTGDALNEFSAVARQDNSM